MKKLSTEFRIMKNSTDSDCTLSFQKTFCLPKVQNLRILCNLFFLLVFMNASAYACPFSSTSLQGGGTLNDNLCVGQSETFLSGPTGCQFANSTHEWVIKRSVYNGNAYSSYQPYQTVIQSNNSPFTFTFNDPGRYEITVVIHDPNNFNIIDAYPCSGTGTCTRAKVWVYGPIEPTFTIDNISCTYNPKTKMYTNDVAILPNVDQSGSHSGLQGTQLDIDWGDGNTESKTIYWNTNHTPITHTYTWHASSSPNLVIAVNASGVCADIGYSKYHVPTSEYYEITPNVIENNCERHTVCFEGIPEGVEVGLYGPKGEKGTFTECITFIKSGTYSIVIPNAYGCPQVYLYTVNIQANPGILSIGQTSVTPGLPLDLSLSGYNGVYIAYEILVTNCNGAPEWVIFEYGPASIYDNHTVAPGITQQFLPCMLTDQFEFCFRARVLCEPFDPDTYENSSISNVVCLPFCPEGEECFGDGSETPTQGLQGQNNTSEFETLAEVSEVEFVDFQIYPNPSSGQLFIEIGDQTDESLRVIEIVNLMGQSIWKSDLSGKNSQMAEVNVTEQAAGLYHVILFQDGVPVSVKPMFKVD